MFVKVYLYKRRVTIYKTLEYQVCKGYINNITNVYIFLYLYKRKWYNYDSTSKETNSYGKYLWIYTCKYKRSK